LKLSTLWAFTELRREAIKGLSKLDLDPVDKVMLARDYKVQNWLVEGYTTLVMRDAAPTLVETRKLGYETSFQLYEMREETFRRGMEQSYHHYGSNSRIFNNLEPDIRRIFYEELVDIKYEEDYDDVPAEEVWSGDDGFLA
jgi:hypothetical protein